MKILGIDPGSIVTGYGVVRKDGRGRLTHLCDGEIRPEPGVPLPERLLVISDAIKRVIDDQTPDAVAIESVFFARNARSAITLGHARAVPLLSAASSGLKVFEYAPRSVKLTVTGYGNATKEQVQKMVGILLNITQTPGPDAADALAVAICHIHSSGMGIEPLMKRNSKRRIKAI
ncbi:MAG: crossover junction endodeoxyribonuclease RuvC [Thermodesulfobacteriota bacterium]